MNGRKPLVIGAVSGLLTEYSSLMGCAPFHTSQTQPIQPCDSRATLEETQGQMDGFFSQLPYKCYLEEVASVGN